MAGLEVLVVNTAVAALIREAKTSQVMSVMQTAKREGMQMLNDELVRFCKEKIVEPHEAYMKCVDKDGLLRGLETAGIKYKPPEDTK